MTAAARHRIDGLRTWGRSRERFVLGFVGVASVLLVWEVASRLRIVRPILVSSPSAVAIEAWRQVSRGLIWDDLLATFAVWLIGFGAASLVGIAIGLAAGWNRHVRYVADPWLNVLHAIPDLALIPIFILWFGIGFEFKVFLVFLSGIFYVAVNTLAGVQATENRFLDVAKTFGADRRKMFRTVLLPGSIPYIATGLRQGSARAIVGVVVAEFVSSNQGIGFRISLAASTLQIDLVMFGVLILAGFGIIVGELLGRFERRFDAWRE